MGTSRRRSHRTIRRLTPKCHCQLLTGLNPQSRARRGGLCVINLVISGQSKSKSRSGRRIGVVVSIRDSCQVVARYSYPSHNYQVSRARELERRGATRVRRNGIVLHSHDTNPGRRRSSGACGLERDGDGIKTLRRRHSQHWVDRGSRCLHLLPRDGAV